MKQQQQTKYKKAENQKTLDRSIIHILLLTFLFWSISLNGQPEIDFSHDRGYFNIPISVSLSVANSPSAEIYYTTDYSKPNLNNGTLYTSAINLNSTSTIRAVAYEGGVASKHISHTYIFPGDIKNASYMYSYMTNHSTYGPLIENALKSIPSISIVSNELTPGTHIEDDEEVSVEMLFPNGKNGFMELCGTETWGSSPTNPKKSYRLEFKKKYGPSSLEYDVFGKDQYETHDYKIPPTKKFDKLLLRAGSQDGLNAEFGHEARAQFLRNRVIMDATIELGFHAAHGRYVHLYFNGQYLGQYHLMERPDGGFFESYFGDDKDNYEVRRKTDKYWDGDGTVYEDLENRINFSNANTIAATKKYIDLESAASYLMIMSYLSGHDWSLNQNSLCGGHIIPNKTPYKFILWDLDLSMGNGGTWYPNQSGNVNYFKDITNEQGPVPSSTSNNITDEPEFRIMLGDALHCACFDNGPLTPNKIEELYTERVNQIDTSIIAEAARWGGFNFTAFQNVEQDNWTPQDWQNEIDRLKISNFPQRTNNLINHFKSRSLYPGLEGVVFSSNGGIVPAGSTVTLTNPNPSSFMYYTTDGSDPRNIGGSIHGTQYSAPITLSSGVIDIKARIKSGSNWSAMCPKRFYVAQAYSAIVINEIHYNPADSITPFSDTIDGKNFEFVELKNTGSSEIFLTDLHFIRGINLSFPYGSKIDANGFITIAEDSTWFHAKYGFAPDFEYKGKLDNGGESLELKGPDGSVLDRVDYGDILPWTPLADSGIYSLGLIDPSLENNASANWSIQGVPYTPGAENVFSGVPLRDYSDLVINEINYNPEDSASGPSGDFFEFVEIKNMGPGRIYLAGLSLAPGISYSFDESAIIEPFDFLTVASDSALFRARYGFSPIGQYSGNLNNSSDQIILQNFFNQTINSVEYQNTLPWPPIQNPKFSIGLIHDQLDNSIGTNWKNQMLRYTPNKTNLFACITSLVENNFPWIDSRIVIVETSIETNGFVLSAEQVLYSAAHSIELKPQFEIELGALFEAKIMGCNE